MSADQVAAIVDDAQTTPLVWLFPNWVLSRITLWLMDFALRRRISRDCASEDALNEYRALWSWLRSTGLPVRIRWQATHGLWLLREREALPEAHSLYSQAAGALVPALGIGWYADAPAKLGSTDAA